MRIAPLYRTAPISPIPQPDFLNTVALATLPAATEDAATGLDPWDVLDRVKALEELAGRREGQRWGPRPLDVDLLWFGDRVASEPARATRRGLTLPHPRLRQRRFVLAPLNDLAPHLQLPPDGAVVGDLLAALGSEQAVERLDWSRR